MRKVVVAAIAFTFSFAASVALATNTWHSSTIQKVYPYGGTNFVLSFSSNAGSCTNSDHYHYVVAGQNGMTADLQKSILAVALMAMATGKSVSVLYDDSTSSCYVSALTVFN